MPKTKTQILMLTLLYGLFAFAILAFGWMLSSGSMTITLLNLQLGQFDIRLNIRLDSLSTILLLMVSFLGIVIGQYSVRYLDGEPRQDAFFRQLCFTVFAVSAMITASNLVTLFLAWLGMSLGLHKLLLFYPERPNALLAARKKFWVSRIGDLFLLIGIVLVYQTFGTFDFQKIFSLTQASVSPEQSLLLSWSGIFFVCGAMTKSAQFPFHFWLPETMETPTPVSALMHAGIINGGGFLLIRLSPLIAHASVASLILAVVGAFTGVYASLIMITQNDIKRKLAYSTISQMGLMMFACGIGAYGFALFHIIAHSLYKAHAFLSTGDLVEEFKKRSLAIALQSAPRMIVFAGFGLGLIVLGLFYQDGKYVPELTYFSVLFLGLSQNSEKLSLRSKTDALIQLLIGSALVFGFFVYVFFENLIHVFTVNELVVAQGQIDAESPLFIICILGYLIFAAGFYLANGLMLPKSPLQKRLYVYLWNGGYFGLQSSRLLRSLRLV